MDMTLVEMMEVQELFRTMGAEKARALADPGPVPDVPVPGGTAGISAALRERGLGGYITVDDGVRLFLNVPCGKPGAERLEFFVRVGPSEDAGGLFIWGLGDPVRVTSDRHAVESVSAALAPVLSGEILFALDRRHLADRIMQETLRQNVRTGMRGGGLRYRLLWNPKGVKDPYAVFEVILRNGSGFSKVLAGTPDEMIRGLDEAITEAMSDADTLAGWSPLGGRQPGSWLICGSVKWPAEYR